MEDFAANEPPIADLSRRFQLAAFYKFVALEELDALREQLLAVAKAGAVQGTILLAAEGLNGTVCGPEEGITRLLGQLRSDRRFADLEAKLSWAPRQSFYRLKVRLKNEIVTMGCPRVKPTEQVGTYVAPQEWDALINDPTTLVVDTRNGYEVAVGTFEGAIDPQISHFRQFPTWVEEKLRPLVEAKKPQRLALFCTGGIRCEKATAYLLQQGFEGVNHLQGGFLSTWSRCQRPRAAGMVSVLFLTSGWLLTTNWSQATTAFAMPVACPWPPRIGSWPAMWRG